MTALTPARRALYALASLWRRVAALPSVGPDRASRIIARTASVGEGTVSNALAGQPMPAPLLALATVPPVCRCGCRRRLVLAGYCYGDAVVDLRCKLCDGDTGPTCDGEGM